MLYLNNSLLTSEGIIDAFQKGVLNHTKPQPPGAPSALEQLKKN